MAKLKTCPLILLAAGKSSRMGEGPPKGLWKVDGKVWLRIQLQQFFRADGSRAVLVLGYRAESYFSEIPALKRALLRPVVLEGVRLSVVINPRPSRGQFSSLQVGISALRQSRAIGAFVLPIDTPGSEKQVWDKLGRAGRTNVWAAIPIYGRRGGHPVWLSRKMLTTLSRVSTTSENARLDLQLRSLDPVWVKRLRVEDSKILDNINRPEDWLKIGVCSNLTPNRG